MLLPLDGPSAQGTVTVNDSTVQEAKAGGSTLSDRKVITMQGDGKFYVYFGDGGSAPSVATVQNHGFTQFKNAIQSYEAGEQQKVYVLALSGSVNVKVAERG